MKRSIILAALATLIIGATAFPLWQPHVHQEHIRWPFMLTGVGLCLALPLASAALWGRLRSGRGFLPVIALAYLLAMGAVAPGAAAYEFGKPSWTD